MSRRLVDAGRLEGAGRLIALARAVANDAPKRRAKYVNRAGIRWRIIEELRAELERWDAESPAPTSASRWR